MIQLLSILFVIMVIFAIRKERILNFSSFFLASILYLIIYGVVPFVISTVEIPSYYTGPLAFLNHPPEEFEKHYYFATSLAFISFLFYWVGYRFSFFKSRYFFQRYYERNNTRRLYKVVIAIFIVGFLFLLLYIALFGSIYNMLLANTRMAYGGNAEVEVESPYLFLIILAKVIIFCSYLYWGLKRIDGSSKLLFYVSLILALFLLFRFSGRMIFMTYLATFVLSDFLLKQRIPKIKMLITAAVAVFVILFGNALFKSVLYEDAFERRQQYYADKDVFLTPFLDVISGFSFPYRNMLHYYKYHNWEYFVDMIQFPLYILPRKIIPISPLDTTIEVNTMNILGVKGGIMPPDIVTYGYLNFGLLGVIITAFLFGVLCKYIDSFQRKNVPAISVVVYVALVFIVAFRVMYFNPKQFSTGYFYFFVSLIIIHLFRPKAKNIKHYSS